MADIGVSQATADRLRDETVIWMSTVTPAGQPQSYPVWFLWTGEVMWVYSKDGVRVRNLGQNGKVNLHLNSDEGGGSVVVIQGNAEVVPDAPASHTVPDYAAKYGPVLAQYGWSWERFETDYPIPIRITPTRVQSFD
jgi:PPOX class probable F420-dependent enzyme